MKRKILTMIVLISLTACGRSKHSKSSSQPQPPSAKTTTAVSEVRAAANVDADGSMLIFRNVDAGTPVIKKRAGQQSLSCASYLPEEETTVNFQFGESLQWEVSEDRNTLTIENPLTLFSLRNLHRIGPMEHPDMPLVGVWEGKRGNSKKDVAEHYHLQILLAKNGYEFHLQKTCSAELKVL